MESTRSTKQYLNQETRRGIINGDLLIPRGTFNAGEPPGGLNFAPVYRGVDMVSSDVAKFVLELHERDPKGGSAVLFDHPLQRLVSRRPTTTLNVNKFWRRLMVQAILWRSAYVLIHRDRMFRPIDFTLLESAFMNFARDTVSGGLLYQYTWPGGQFAGLVEHFMPHDILHIEGLNVHHDDDYIPLTPPTLIELMRTTLALGIGAEDFGAAFFRNGGRLGGLLELPPSLPDDVRKHLESEFRSLYERADAAWRVIQVQGFGVKFSPASGITAKDAQMVESREQARIDVALWIGLRPHQLGSPGSFSFSSLESETRAYFSQTLQSWLVAIQSECDMKLLPPSNRNDGSLFFKHRTLPFLMSGDMSDMIATGSRWANDGLGTVNEYRQLLGLNPIEGGDILRMPHNTQSASEGLANDSPANPDQSISVPANPDDSKTERPANQD